MLGSHKVDKEEIYVLIDEDGKKILRPTFEQFEETSIRPDLDDEHERELFNTYNVVATRMASTSLGESGGGENRPPIQMEGIDDDTRNVIVRFLDELHAKDTTKPNSVKRMHALGDSDTVIVKFNGRPSCPIAKRIHARNSCSILAQLSASRGVLFKCFDEECPDAFPVEMPDYLKAALLRFGKRRPLSYHVSVSRISWPAYLSA